MSALRNSVIICTRNRLWDIMRALPSLGAQSVLPDELIIVDSSTEPISQNEAYNELVNQLSFPTYTYVHTSPGLPYQRNIGVAHATGDLVHFFDDDVILARDYLAIMTRIFMSNERYLGGMGSVQNMYGYGDAFLCQLFRSFFLLQRNYARGKFTLSGMPTHAYGTDTFKEVEVLGGCCMSYRGIVFEQHVFDERLSGYAFMEDCDFSYRVSQDGPLFFTPEAKLEHFHSPVAREAQERVAAMTVHNYTYLFFKNFYPRNRLRIIAYYWSLLGLFLEALMRRRWGAARGYLRGFLG